MSNDNSEIELTSMGGPSYEILALQEYLSNTKKQYNILDLGCGDGRNSIFFSSLGHKVTAIDTSKSYISFLKQAADFGNYHLEPICSDVRNWNFDKSFDVILAHGLLHYFPKEYAISFIKKIQKHTKEGGVNIITIAPSTEDGDIPEDFKRAGHVNPFIPMEIKKQYDGWKLVLREHYVKWDSHPGVGVHSHPIEKWIFVKQGHEEFPISAKIIQDTSSYLPVCNDLESNFNKIKINSKFSESYFSTVDMDKITRYEASGIQLSSKRLSTSGYILYLYQVKNYVLYIESDVIIGKR